ncbi:hypothetical protein [Micromonospora sp. DT231]|uniref:hypothetical protein n=1 Tax=Micromonospora sp. DT231 TaxID=3416526 RepID=UPI003CF2D198
MTTGVRIRRWAGRAAAVAALAGVSLAATTTAAQASDDWYNVGAKSGQCRLAHSVIWGADTDTSICWSGYDVWVLGYVEDTGADGLRAVLQIKYDVWINGKWVSHNRNYLSDTNSADGGTSPIYWSRARYPTKNLWARACTYTGSSQVECDDPWR